MTGIEFNLIPLIFLKTGVFVWLSIWTLLDIIFHYKQRCFFIKTLDVINLNTPNIRGEKPLLINHSLKNKYIYKLKGFFGYSIPIPKQSEPRCPSLDSCGNDPNLCPIMRQLGQYLRDVENDSGCIKENITIINDMWNIVRRSSVIRPQQAAFLELLIIQIFIIVFWPVLMGAQELSLLFIQSSLWTATFSIALFILLCLLVMSYISSRPLSVYENRTIRFILIFGSWLVFFAYLHG